MASTCAAPSPPAGFSVERAKMRGGEAGNGLGAVVTGKVEASSVFGAVAMRAAAAEEDAKGEATEAGGETDACVSAERDGGMAVAIDASRTMGAPEFVTEAARVGVPDAFAAREGSPPRKS